MSLNKSILACLLVVNVAFANDNILKVPSFGLEVEKPKTWHWGTTEQHQENLSRTKWKDKKTEELVAQYSSTPLVVMMKHEEPYNDLNPSLKIDVRPYGNLSGKKPSEILNLVLPSFKQMFSDLEIATEPLDTLIGGLKSGYMKINYTMKTKDGLEFPTCSEMLIIDKKQYYYMVGFATRQDEKTGKRKEIYDVIKRTKF